MPMFRVLQGKHSEGQRGPDGKLIKYGRGDIFHSASDLDKKFNSPISIKYERLPDGTLPTHAPVAQAAEEGFKQLNDGNKLPDPSFDLKKLQAMDVNALIKLAQEEEIDLGNLKKKDEIISQIQKCLLAPVG